MVLCMLLLIARLSELLIIRPANAANNFLRALEAFTALYLPVLLYTKPSSTEPCLSLAHRYGENGYQANSQDCEAEDATSAGHDHHERPGSSPPTQMRPLCSMGDAENTTSTQALGTVPGHSGMACASACSDLQE